MPPPRPAAGAVHRQAEVARSEVLASFAHAANLSVPDLGRLLPLLAERVSQLIGDMCAISLVSDDGEWLELAALQGRDPDRTALAARVLASSRQRVDEGTDAVVVRTGETFFRPAAELRALVKTEYRRLLDDLDVCGMVTAPLLVRGRVIGTTTVVRTLPSPPYTEADRILLEDLADQAALAIDNATLYAASLRTERFLRDNEESLRAAVAAAKARTAQQEHLAALGQLAAGVAHDFNNVVTVISLSAQLLEGQAGLDQAGRDQVGHLRREAERAAAMVWQFLDFAHQGPLRLVAVDLDDFFQDLVPALQRSQPPWAPICFETDGRGHRVMADPGRLEQIVRNLVTNATDASPAGGDVDITLGLARRPGSGPTPWARIAVSDRGAGIAPDVLPRIFEPFFSTKPVGRGTGLGLAQVQGLVNQHDGLVEVASSPDAGTTVTVWIPAVAGGLHHAPDFSPPRGPISRLPVDTERRAR